MEEVLERLVKEELELCEKIAALLRFIYQDQCEEEIGTHSYELLSLQQTTMLAYRQVLSLRIKDMREKIRAKETTQGGYQAIKEVADSTSQDLSQ